MTCVNPLDTCTDLNDCASIKQAVNMLNAIVKGREKGNSLKWLLGMIEHWGRVLLRHIGEDREVNIKDIGLEHRTLIMIWHYYGLIESNYKQQITGWLLNPEGMELPSEVG